MTAAPAAPSRPVLIDTQLRCMKFAAWPARDRETWLTNATPGDIFDDPRPADHLRPDSIANYRQGYGRWLTFLADRDALDPEAAPTARVTPRLVWAYLLELHRRGNAPATIVGRFGALHMALRILAPEVDMDWVRQPRGHTVASLLPRQRRRLLVPDARVLVQWAQDMMAAAEQDLGLPSNRGVFRNGLYLGMLAARARRIRAVTALRVGQELVFRSGRFEIDLNAGLVKTAKEDWFPLPAYLTQPIRLYLDVVRPALLGGRDSDRLWISAEGAPISKGGLQMIVQRLTKARFGVAFGPHRFRHAIATTVALHASDQPHLAASVLNITSKVADKHYNRARQVQASLAYEKLLAERRKSLGVE